MLPDDALNCLRLKASGGERGIRTLETVSRLHTFQACAFDHSATSPSGAGYAGAGRGCKLAARAFARETDYTEEQALAQIIEMFEAEIARPTDTGTTAPRSQ